MIKADPQIATFGFCRHISQNIKNQKSLFRQRSDEKSKLNN